MRLASLIVLAGTAWGQSLSHEAQFSAASAALTSGNYPEAERRFRLLENEMPGDPSVLGNLGVIYSRLGKQAEAIAAYQKVLRTYPDNAGIHLNLGLVYFKQSDYARALPHFLMVLQQKPGNAQADQLAAACELNTGYTSSAIARLEAIRSHGPADENVDLMLAVAYHKANRSNEANGIVTELFKTGQLGKVEFLLGRAYYDATLFSDAEDAFRKALQVNPHLEGAHRELGKVLVSERKMDDAIGELQLALQEDSSDREAEYFLGATLAQEGRDRDAEVYLERAVQHSPASWGALYYLGKLRLQEQDYSRAAALLKQAVALNPDNAAGFYALSRALRMQGKTAEAKAALDRVRDLKANALKTEIHAVSGAK